MRFALLAALALSFLAVGCQPAGEGTAALPGEPVTGDPTTTDTGLEYYVLAEGEGTPAQAGQEVSVHYTGYLTDTTKFDSSLDRNQPFTFVLGTGSVIPGWDEGVALMKPGAKHKLVIPADLGYGAEGVPGTIPPGATLVFDVELLEVK